MASGNQVGSRFAPAVVLALSLLVAGLPAACAGGEDRTHGSGRILVIGVDGLEWEILLPLLRRGELPHLAGLMEEGVAGYLETLDPTLSPVIWTSIATGKPPAEHGIRNFTYHDDTGKERLFTSRDRRVKALWNILTDTRRTVNVIGWWNTWPAERVHGVMVSQFSSLEQGKKVWKGTVHEDWPAQTWPGPVYEEILPLVRQVNAEYPVDLEPGVDELPPAVAELIPFLPPQATSFERRLAGDSLWAFRADETYARIARTMLAERPADLTLVYLGSPDVVGHRFFRHFRPEEYRHPPRDEAVAAFGDVIPATYRFFDRIVGELVTAAGPETAVIVLSDHGMAPVNTGKDFEWAFENAEERYRLAAVNSGHHLRAEPGVLIAAGPSIRRSGEGRFWEDPAFTLDRLPELGSIFDVAPTLLYLLDLAVGADMVGLVITDLVDEPILRAREIAYTPTYETVEGSPGEEATEPFEGVDEERLRQLKSLGYID
jgi:hypothetical protein